MPNDPYDPSPSQGFNPADFLTQVGFALSIMDQRDPAKAAQMYLGLQEMQRHRQREQGQQMATAQDQQGLRGLLAEIQRAMAIEGGQGTPPSGMEGLRPVEQTGFGHPEAFQGAQRTIDPATLQQLMVGSPSVAKLAMDPQMQSFWQNQGLMKHPEQAKLDIQQRNRGRTAPTLSGPMARLTGISAPDASAILENVPSEHLGNWMNAPAKQQRADIAQQQADTQADRAQTYEKILSIRQELLDLQKQVQGGETPMSQKQMEKLDAAIALLNQRTAALNAETPFIAPKAEADIAAKKESVRRSQASTPKGGKPTEKDKDVDALAMEMRQVGQAQADDMVKKSALLNLGVPNPLHLRAYQKAFGQGQQRTTSSPSGLSPQDELDRYLKSKR